MNPVEVAGCAMPKFYVDFYKSTNMAIAWISDEGFHRSEGFAFGVR